MVKRFSLPAASLVVAAAFAGIAVASHPVAGPLSELDIGLIAWMLVLCISGIQALVSALDCASHCAVQSNRHAAEVERGWLSTKRRLNPFGVARQHVPRDGVVAEPQRLVDIRE